MKKRVVGIVIFLIVFTSAILLLSPTGKGSGIQASATVPEIGDTLDYTGNIPSVVEDFEQRMEEELDSSRTVGAAYTIVQGGRILLTRTYGECITGSGRQVDEHTIFRLASVSKGFSGALLCRLELEGLLSLDDRVADHYEGFSLKDSINTTDMTIRHLLSHTSGLVPYAFDNLVEAEQPLEDIILRLNEVDISASPGELYGYQNVMFSMVDPIAEKASGTSYADLMQEMIFRPLGMRDASAGEVDSVRRRNMACPHVRTRSGYVAVRPHTGYYNVLPAAGVNASIYDMSQWLQALLGFQPVSFPDTIREVLSDPIIYTPLKYRYTRYWKPFTERYYSLGWRIYFYQGRKIVYHGGYIRGYRAEVAFCPSENIGIAFLQNSPNSLASKVVPMFLDSWFGQSN